MKKQFDPIHEPSSIPGFQCEDHIYRLLNLRLDIEADGVTYHLSSEFAGEDEMGAVIDIIELERSQRNSA